MDWIAALARNRDALLRVVAMLVATAGMGPGAGAVTLPRHLRLEILRTLRPAEAALRRLLVVAARRIKVVLSPLRTAAPKPAKARKPAAKRPKTPSFAVIEPLQRTAPAGPRYAPGPGPRIFFFDGFDPVVEAAPPPPTPDDPMEAGALCRRLHALQTVLENVPKYAERLARWRARRAADSKPGRLRPLRPGRPPGHRKRQVHEVDEVLADCHTLALWALKPPDTS